MGEGKWNYNLKRGDPMGRGGEELRIGKLATKISLYVPPDGNPASGSRPRAYHEISTISIICGDANITR